MKRRTVLRGFAGAASTMAIGPLYTDDKVMQPTAPACQLITQDITGPYYLDPRQLRSDLTEGQPGMPLQLDFQVVGTLTCQPLPGAQVHIWQCNAEGYYSGVKNLVFDSELRPTGKEVDFSDRSFLRGAQSTDADGRVLFQTIVPGWYSPRPTHLHLKVYPPTFGEVATTQLYFPPAFCDEVFQHEAYAARGPSPVRYDHRSDSGNSSSDEEELWITPVKAGAGYQHSMQLGVTFYGKAFGELSEFYQQG